MPIIQSATCGLLNIIDGRVAHLGLALSTPRFKAHLRCRSLCKPARTNTADSGYNEHQRMAFIFTMQSHRRDMAAAGTLPAISEDGTDLAIHSAAAPMGVGGHSA